MTLRIGKSELSVVLESTGWDFLSSLEVAAKGEEKEWPLFPPPGETQRCEEEKAMR